MPSPNFSAVDCVKAQLDCLIHNDAPWYAHDPTTRCALSVSVELFTVADRWHACWAGQTTGYSARMSLVWLLAGWTARITSGCYGISTTSTISWARANPNPKLCSRN